MDCTEDHSMACDAAIKEACRLEANAQYHEALDTLISLEKQTRQSSDSVSTARLLVTLVRICFRAKQFTDLNDQILVYTKKKLQSKEAIKAMVAECITFIDKLDERREKVRLIETLRAASEGKIYLEVERARLTRILADIRESDADVEGAAALMDKLQINTYGSMDKEEKVGFIIAQMRLLVQTEQLTKAQIISKRINPSFFEATAHRDLKHQFYSLMVEVDKTERFLCTARHYLAMHEPGADNARMLHSAVLYCILAPASAEQKQLLTTLSATLESNRFCSLVQLFLGKELIDWSDLLAAYKTELTNFSFLDTSSAYGIQCWKELRTRTIEHNIGVFATYYVRIRLARMSELLVLSDSETEKHLTRLICDGDLRAKIDRPAGIVYFRGAHQSPEERLNKWLAELMQVMALLSKTNHLISASSPRDHHRLSPVQS